MFVHADVHDEFVAKLREQVDAMVMGDPLDEKTDIGTIISPEQFAKVKSYIDHGKGEAGAGGDGTASSIAARPAIVSRPALVQ